MVEIRHCLKSALHVKHAAAILLLVPSRLNKPLIVVHSLHLLLNIQCWVVVAMEVTEVAREAEVIFMSRSFLYLLQHRDHGHCVATAQES